MRSGLEKKKKLYTKSKRIFYVQQFSFPENHVVYKVIRKNMVEPDRPKMPM